MNYADGKRGSPPYLLSPFLALLIICILFLTLVQAQAPPPITPSGLNTHIDPPVALPSGEIQHNITGGTRPENGANLFHSFGEFGVPDNNIANFQNDSGLPTSNILGRVTGGNVSNIFGTIQTEGFGNANLFLTNPAGWVFGPNAALNVAGSVNFTTADYLKHSDGAQFTALPNEQLDSQLSVAAISSFGFLAANPAGIVVDGSTLSVTEGHSISLVSGDITIGSGLTAQGGQINLASVASPGEILAGTLDQAPNVNGESFGALGTIQVSQKAVIDASGDGGGTVRIRGGRLVVDDSTISANTTGPAVGPLVGEPGEGIDIQVSQDLVIQNAAVLETNVAENVAPGIGSGGVHVKADHIEIVGSLDFMNFTFTGIRSNVAPGSAGGPSGNIQLEANSILVRGPVVPNVGIQTETLGSGNAGNIILRTTDDIDLDNGALITLAGPGSGSSGNVELTSTEGNIFLRDTSMSFGSTVTSQAIFSNGNAGNITVNAPQGDIVITDRTAITTRVQGGGVTGSGGIQFMANNLEMDNARVQIDNFLPFAPGDITVNVSNRLSLDGNSITQTTTRGPARSSDLNITAKDIFLTEGSSLSTETFGPGSGGELNVVVDNLQLTNGAQLRSSSTRLDRPNQMGEFIVPSGSGGTINVQGLEGPTDLVMVDGAGSAILTDAEGTGNAGNINISTEQLQLTNGGQLSSGSSIGFTPPGEQPFVPTGSGGTINLGLENQPASVEIDGAGSGIFTDTVGSGNAGSINVNAIDLTMSAGAEISSRSLRQETDAGGGGSIQIHATNSINLSATTIATSVEGGSNPGGNILITTGQNMQLTNNTTVTAESSGLGNSGTLMLNATDGNFQSVDSTVSTSAQQAEGGSIEITAGQNFQLTNDSTVLAESSGAGNSGSVTLTATGGNFQSVDSTVSTSAQQAEGGDITITAGQNVQLVNDTTVSAESFGPGDAGDVTVTSGNNIQMVNSAIRTNAAAADGGNIKLTAPNQIQLINSQITSSVGGGPTTTGGNINIDPLFIFLQNSQILANAFQGAGGNITLTATNGIFIGSSSIVDASSALGISGLVVFNGAVVALAETVTQLPQNIVKIASLFAERCAAQKGGQFSSFVQGGSDGLPPAPGGFLTSPLMFTNPGAQPSSALPTPGQAAFVFSLPQLRLGLDHVIGSPDDHLDFGFRAMNLLPEPGCAA